MAAVRAARWLRLLVPLLVLITSVILVGGAAAAAGYATTQVYMSNRNCQGDPDAFVFAPWPTPTNSSACVQTPCNGVVPNAPGASQSRACTTSTATPFFSSYALQETFASATCVDAAPNSTLAARLGTCVPALGSSNRFVRLSCLDVLGTTVTVALCNDAACSVCPTLTTATAGACIAGVRYSCPVIYVMSLWFWVAVGGGGLLCVVVIGVTICCCRRRQHRKREEEGFDNVIISAHTSDTLKTDSFAAYNSIPAARRGGASNGNVVAGTAASRSSTALLSTGTGVITDPNWQPPAAAAASTAASSGAATAATQPPSPLEAAGVSPTTLSRRTSMHADAYYQQAYQQQQQQRALAEDMPITSPPPLRANAAAGGNRASASSMALAPPAPVGPAAGAGVATGAVDPQVAAYYGYGAPAVAWDPAVVAAWQAQQRMLQMQMMHMQASSWHTMAPWQAPTWGPAGAAAGYYQAPGGPAAAPPPPPPPSS